MRGQTRDQKQQKEAIDINKSLFNLRQVITALTENSKIHSKMKQGDRSARGLENVHYIPYRESKLTTILRQSLGGNSYCLMIANLSPISAFVDENLSTLQYASKASHISNQPKINQDPRAVMIMEQKSQITKL